MRLSRHAALAFALAIAASRSASAVTHTWSGGNGFGPDSMSNSLNWGGGTPVSGGSNLTLIFPGSASSFTPNQNIASPLVLQSLQQTGGFYNFVGSAYRFANLGAAPTISNATSIQFTAGIDLQNDTTWTSNSLVLLSGPMTGAGDLLVTGNATSTFQVTGAGSSTHTGTLSFTNFNQVVFNRSGTATAGALVLNNASLSTNSNNQLSSNSDVFLSNTGNWLMNANQQARDISLTGGCTIGMSSSQTLSLNGNISESGAGLSYLGSGPLSQLDLNGSPRQISVTNNPNADWFGINATISNGSFVKTGPGLLLLGSSSNSFNAQNLISAGVVQATVDSIGSVSIASGARLKLLGGNLSSPVLFGSGTTEFYSYHVFTVSQSYSGVSDVRGGGGLMGEPQYLPTNVTSSDSGFLIFQGAGSGTYSGAVSGGVQMIKSGTGTVSVSGSNTHTGGLDLQQGSIRVLSDGAFGTGGLQMGGNSSASNFEGVGNRTLANPISTLGMLNFTGGGNLNFTDAGNKIANYPIAHNSVGTTQMSGKFTLAASGVLTVNSGTLILGNPAQVGGFTSSGQIIVNGGNLTVRSLNFTTLPDVTLAGGTLNAPNGYAIPLGAALQGNGGVTGRVSSANGSSVLANGNLTMGDPSHLAGVNLDGELYTNQYNVTLLDSNQSVLGSLTQIGTSSAVGTLTSANGLVLNFGRNVAGRGTIISTNLLANACIMNGDVQGDSIANYIDFTGYVKGVGNFNNVAFSGTFAPGLSPALLTVGNVILTSSNVLDMELGGLNRGSQYDAFDVTGQMKFGGTLQMSYINSFTPTLGDQFDLFNGTTTGTFNAFNLPPLPNSWQWDTSLLYSQGIVQVVVPEPTSFALLLAIPLLRRRR